MDKNDLAALLVDASAEEVDRIHRLLHEWSVGPENSFPVQLALLTKAQWRVAATLPRVMKDSRKLIELHLAEYRRQSQAITDEFIRTASQQTAELKTATEINVLVSRQAAEQIKVRLGEAEAVARQVKLLMESAASEWRGIKASTTAQCKHLEEISGDLQDRCAWRVVVWWAAWLSAAFGLGYCLAINSIR
jgi:hypothetical protein